MNSCQPKHRYHSPLLALGVFRACLPLSILSVIINFTSRAITFFSPDLTMVCEETHCSLHYQHRICRPRPTINLFSLETQLPRSPALKSVVLALLELCRMVGTSAAAFTVFLFLFDADLILHSLTLNKPTSDASILSTGDLGMQL